MARSIEVIKQQMIDTKATLSSLDGLTSNSQVSIFGQLFFVNATNIAILEQLIDAYIAEIETIINAQAIGSTPWIRAKILEFQYSTSPAQFVELDTIDFSISYPVIDESLRIVTRCSVKETGNLIVLAKVAKEEPPVPLSGVEQTALSDYLSVIKPAGIQINVISLTSDKLYINGVVLYSGQYSSVIRDNVEAALATYMDNLSSADNFNGIVKVNDIIDAIQAVQGVKDVKLDEVAVRPDASAFADRIIVYKLSTGVNNIEQETASGYIVEETTSGKDFTTNITYTAV